MTGRKALVLLGAVTFGQEALAHAQMTNEQRFNLGSVEVNMGVGLLNGQARETVYDVEAGGKKISQLNWDFKQVPTLHLGLTYHPQEWLSLDLTGWTHIAKGDSHMKDYDWLSDEHADWSHYSDHPDTRVKTAWQAEVSATAWAIKREDVALGFMLGYQHSQFGWESRGGRYHHSSQEGYRDLSGEFQAGEKVISYKQRYDTPYVGLVGIYNFHDWTLESRFKYSQWVKARDFDTHHRDRTFTGNHGNKGRMQSLAVALSYHVTPRFSVKAGVDYQVNAEAKGSTLIKDLGDGSSEGFGGNSSGQASKMILSTLAVGYQF